MPREIFLISAASPICCMCELCNCVCVCVCGLWHCGGLLSCRRILRWVNYMQTQSPRWQRGRGNRFYSRREERIAAAADLRGEWLINMFAPEFPPPPNIRAMLIAWCADIWKSPSGGQIAQAFRIFEAVTPTLQRWKPLKCTGLIFLSHHNRVVLVRSAVSHPLVKEMLKQSFWYSSEVHLWKSSS